MWPELRGEMYNGNIEIMFSRTLPSIQEHSRMHKSNFKIQEHLGDGIHSKRVLPSTRQAGRSRSPCISSASLACIRSLSSSYVYCKIQEEHIKHLFCPFSHLASIIHPIPKGALTCSIAFVHSNIYPPFHLNTSS